MSNKFTGITSAGSAIPVYDKDAHSALSQKLDTTALAPAIEAAVSGKQDAGDYYSASNPSGFISSVPETYLQNSDLTISEGKITEISGIPLSAGDELPEIVTQAANYVSAQSGTWDSVTGKQDAGDYYSASNPSGFIDANALTPYQTIEGMTAYQPAGNYQPSGDYLSASESANFYPMTGNPSGFISSVPDTYLQNTDLTVSDGKVTEISGIPLSAGGDVPEGVMVESAVGYNAVNEISGYNGSAIAQYGAEKQWLVHDDTLVHAANSAQYALGVNLSAVAQLLGVDETVLYSGNLYTSGGVTFTVSEPLDNFERIKIWANDGNSWSQIIFETDPNWAGADNVWRRTIPLMLSTKDMGNGTIYFRGIGIRSSATTNITGMSAYGWSQPLGGNFVDHNCQITKIVGIGRKN